MDLPVLPYLLKPMKYLFAEHYDKMEEKTRRKNLAKNKKERKARREAQLDSSQSSENGNSEGNGRIKLGRFTIGDWAKSKVACDRVGIIRKMSTGNKDDGPEHENKIKQKDSDAKEKVDKTKDVESDDEDTPVDRIKTKCGQSVIKEAKPSPPQQSPT